MSNSLRPHALQHAKLPCPSPSPWVCSNSCPLSQGCHPTIPSSVAPFSSCPQSFPTSGSFLSSWIHVRKITRYMFVPPPPAKIACWNLILNMTAFETGPSGGDRSMSLDFSWMDRVLIKETLRAPLSLLPCEDTTRRWASPNQEAGPRQTQNLQLLDLELVAFRTARNEFLPFTSYPVYDLFVIAAGAD